MLCSGTSSSVDQAQEGEEGPEYSLPRSINSLADAIRTLADRHLSHCSKLTAEERRVFEESSQRRLSGEGNGGPSWQEEESDRQMLVEFCTARCQQLGIINKLPENSGIVFREPMFSAPMGISTRFALHPQQQQQQHGFPPGFPQYDPIPVASADPRYPSAAVGTSRDDKTPPPQQMTSTAGDTAAYYRHPSYDLPENFPFFQDPVDGDWFCKSCCHVHPQYRDPNYRWSTVTKTPPPGEFIDHHLSLCRYYPQGVPLEYQPAQSPGYASRPQSASFNQPASSGWEATMASRASTQPPMSGIGPLGPADFPPSYHPSASSSPGLAQRTFSPVPLRDTDVMEVTTRQAIEFLVTNDKSIVTLDGAPLPIQEQLVRDEDKLLLTDFLFYLMKQLRLVRFSEADRKTRGGKREKILIGFGGLQCVHCAQAPKSRKFFWSGVDRLANSFAEIPAHVFKCKHCHDDVKDALNTLKKIHPEQMARLPRGSQKVFFRRVWKRLHENDPPPSAEKGSPKQPPGMSESGGHEPSPAGDKDQSPSGTSGSDESFYMLERPTKEAAKALAESAMHSGLPSPSSRVLLAIPEDRDFLSDTDCFIRKQLEIFCATNEDVRVAQVDRKYPIKPGQVGIRCVHCAMAKGGSAASGHAVAYPFSVSGIFEAVREFQRLHLEYCEHLPPSSRAKLSNIRESTTITSIQRKYYVLAAKGLGLRDTKDGVRAGSESVPVVAQAVFSFSEEIEGGFPEELDSLQRSVATPSAVGTTTFSGEMFSSPDESRKRRSSDDAGIETSPPHKKLTPKRES